VLDDPAQRRWLDSLRSTERGYARNQPEYHHEGREEHEVYKKLSETFVSFVRFVVRNRLVEWSAYKTSAVRQFA
jgi:hypothetical protein